MAVKSFRPITPTLRYQTVADFSVLTPKSEVPKAPKRLYQSLNKSGGRNVYGRMTVRHIGGGHKRKYRVIDFARDKEGIPGTIASVEYDPNRSAYISLVKYADGDQRYIITPNGVKVGDSVQAGGGADVIPGNCLMLKEIPVGTMLHNLELVPGRGAKIARSAGNAAQLMAKEGLYCQVKLPSGEFRLLHSNCKATIGQVSNLEHENITIGKAGRSRWLGIRPSVRGVAMNPVDHPMGGGEGRSSGGRHPCTPWGKPTKGYKTRKNKLNNRFILKRRK